MSFLRYVILSDINIQFFLLFNTVIGAHGSVVLSIQEETGARVSTLSKPREKGFVLLSFHIVAFIEKR